MTTTDNRRNRERFWAPTLSPAVHSAMPSKGKAMIEAIAARRVAAFGSVHRRLHLLDNQRTVEFSQYLHLLCKDLSVLLFQQDDDGHSITVEGPTIEIETATAIGFIVNELTTNSAKYAPGNVVIQFRGTPAAGFTVGPGPE
jgi:two-component sensor histidine kinase